ncbi:EAL domain-containing protein [Massilia sp. P8910]|uniref:bifunctional diguanylate cyclase/phosphodiesterase n=1 Tax=Massilia antarctica TaxID=2765360 RepID=UPI0006BB7411|nr:MULTISPECIES: EAL domain-containing protein [Massilia]MCE3605139.1 EAL domain-containing protein [Massilia antarctica]MCY0912691.1 EAL domain-containing protein [Massilia sp. H27-R4]CUI03756.1 diguanylate cyclase/phosphodiesterase (GGDEF & EAL domains) with PAS/PAC sensor(s) [Janthinobacterium sp. CG23_2]CUU27542.1 diguanylate cyclase/phosphodiesterase (GGDEF & EAL domains) with PAS/PAC sensor(s) [Janthinobacterium sp. CG23_2]
MLSTAYQRFRTKLSRLYGLSIYGALMLVVFGGLVIPAIIGSYVLIGVQERTAARAVLSESLRRNVDILALGMQESLWNMNAESAQSLVESVMRDPSVLHIRVIGQSDAQFINIHSAQRPVGQIYRAERDILVRGERIGVVVVEMDDARSQQELRNKQSNYAFVLAFQLTVSLVLIVLFLNKRLLVPLRQLMKFSDRLSHGDFETRLELEGSDELGRLAKQMEQMRVAIKHLFEDIGRREERFRTIVTQVPGAVFRVRPGGSIDFVSDAIEDISGYPAALFLRSTTDAWSDLICPEDRRMQSRTVREAMASGRPYEIEYRIVDAAGIERWVSENGQPQAGAVPEKSWVDGIIADISERKSNEMRIEALLTEQSAILDNVMFGVMFVRERRIVSANRRCEDLFGYASGEMTGKLADILYPSHDEFVRAGEQQYAALAEDNDYNEERQYMKKDGSAFWCRVSGCALDPGRPNGGSIWVYADVTERREAEEKLRLSATVLEHIADAVVVIDVDLGVVAVNPAFTRITGFSESDAVGKDVRLTRSPTENAAVYQQMWAELGQAGFWRGERWDTRKNGDVYLQWLTVSAVRDDHGVTTHYVAVFSDITKAKQSQEQLDHMAHHDSLTALPNRLLFHDRLLHALKRAARDGQRLAVLFIDLDRFKNVNDTLGHHVGDELLKQVAAALQGKLREGDTLARLGGDEFIVLLENVSGQSGAGQVAEKLMAMFEQPFIVSDYELFVTGSVGISVFPDDAADLNMLIRNADVAMYQAKARGRNGYQFYAPSMTGEGVERLRLEALLRRSIDKNEIFLNYQPQVEIDSGRLVGVEALVRWHNPELGNVPPVRFIPLAEDTGFINQLGKWVLDEACRQMIRWEAAGLHVPKIAVNLSVKQFERGSIVNMVADILKETGLAPQRLQLEVTESVIMNTGDALVFINDLHSIGVGLAIDDFGTGYSSLAYLKQLPVQTLKIDRSFIKDISTDVNDEAIAIAIIQLGKSMNLSVIAEGVETEEQAAFLLRHGCNLAQGYLYSRPELPETILARWPARLPA